MNARPLRTSDSYSSIPGKHAQKPFVFIVVVIKSSYIKGKTCDFRDRQLRAKTLAPGNEAIFGRLGERLWQRRSIFSRVLHETA
jgi:hypothetical protein